MSKSAFEIIDKANIRIEDRNLSAHFYDSPTGFQYFIDATSNKRDKVVQQLYVHELRNIYPSLIPNGIQIHISEPKSEFSNTCSTEIQKLNGLSELQITINLLYSDWHLPINLANFVITFKQELLNQIDAVTKVAVDSDYVGFFVSCTVSAPSNLSFYDTYRNLDEGILATYRNCISRIPSLLISSQNTELTTTESSRLRWWTQNVLVPIVGSGTFVAFIAWLATHL